ncbi:MAG: polysaccharide pyruvyl transferase family protein [Bdellovibrionales bacterium]
MFKNHLRKLILKLFPFLRHIKRWLVWGPTIRAWKKVAASLPVAAPHASVRKILIVPSDPYTLTGSRGDDAMIDALLGVARDNNKDVELFIVTGSDEADTEARKKGLSPCQIWASAFSPEKILAEFKKLSPDALVVIGADVMDGYYNPYLPLHGLMFADLASRLGARAFVLGFSFNKSPWKQLKAAFELTNNAVKINVRDPISMERFNAFCSRPADLVADAAFCLKPALDSDLRKKVTAWVEEVHQKGHLAIAFNIHPMLFKNATQTQIDHLVAAATSALEAVSKARKVSWLFLPHDFREDVGDNACLTPLAKILGERGLSGRIFHITKDHSAAELKAAASQVDGVITARMHLSIGSLGMGVPVAAITYQDKFQGLFRHFDLPDWLLVSPDEVLSSTKLEKMMLRFIDENAQIKAMVAQKLPEVMRLSMKNFEPLL